jgi:hypothetical protein
MDHLEQMDAIQKWNEDGFELEDAVDQEKFEQAYGFKYESSTFDRWIKDQEVVQPVM